MPFSKPVREEALVRSQRHCCVCHEFVGRSINVHHIQQECDGGPNTLENAIVLCLRCHAEAGHFNVKHPMGTSYSPKELIRHRDNWWDSCTNGKANLQSSIDTGIKRTFTSPTLHKYKLLVNYNNGNQSTLSDYKLVLLISSKLNPSTQDLEHLGTVIIDHTKYEKFECGYLGKVYPSETRELLNLDFVFLEYVITEDVYDNAKKENINIRWEFYSESEPVKSDCMKWESLQEY